MLIKRYLVAGVLVWLPIWATVAVVKFCIGLMDQTLALLPAHYQPDVVFGMHIPGLGIVLVFAILLLTGLLMANFLGRRVMAWSEMVVSRIPLVRTVYHGVKQSLQVVFSSNGRSFRQVLLVEYPRKGMWSIAFLTNDGFDAAKAATGEQLVTIFVPTTPNPTSGFLMMVPEADVIRLDISVEKALKLVISLGTVLPDELPEELTE